MRVLGAGVMDPHPPDLLLPYKDSNQIQPSCPSFHSMILRKWRGETFAPQNLRVWHSVPWALAQQVSQFELSCLWPACGFAGWGPPQGTQFICLAVHWRHLGCL